jgi:hypothetical protein
MEDPEMMRSEFSTGAPREAREYKRALQADNPS